MSSSMTRTRAADASHAALEMLVEALVAEGAAAAAEGVLLLLLLLLRVRVVDVLAAVVPSARK